MYAQLTPTELAGDTSFLTALISNLGFPIFVALWLLWERRTIANLLAQRIDEIIDLLQRHNAQHNPHDHDKPHNEK
jgi:hypothetical protein